MNAHRTFHLCLGMLIGIVLTMLCRERIRKCIPVQFTATVATQPFPKSMVSNRRMTLLRQIYSIDITKAMEMRRRQNVLCYINTYTKNLLVKAVHVRHTWARKCGKYFFMSSTQDNVTNTVALNLTEGEGRQHLWSKMQAIMRHLNRLSDQYDYFYKTDDDSYAVLENLWLTVSSYNPNERFFMGYPFYHLVRDGHLSGGAGYLLSRAAFKAIVDEALGKHPGCPTYDEDKEDVKVTLCGYAVGVKLLHIVDRHTTFPFRWRKERLNEYRFQWQSLRMLFNSSLRRPMNKPSLNRFRTNDPFIKDSRSVLSELMVGLHYNRPAQLYIIEFIIYHLRPAGITYLY
ncbi:hypothetical protein EG68_02999 [Paragonimus skrjabini miyazakii]|uniref:N-acetylgalactosaminide beta-1,3-galactosyltransferase n=1 Tax=Paragonimus skrjabini miyazakii TaxID=59628 RepID=A0A8S9Z2N6_9TREM|nr:hypothetical protein EG68_02999 [Paragonimus skrjabini miyazakii]